MTLSVASLAWRWFRCPSCRAACLWRAPSASSTPSRARRLASWSWAWAGTTLCACPEKHLHHQVMVLLRTRLALLLSGRSLGQQQNFESHAYVVVVAAAPLQHVLDALRTAPGDELRAMLARGPQEVPYRATADSDLSLRGYVNPQVCALCSLRTGTASPCRRQSSHASCCSHLCLATCSLVASP